VTIIAESLRYIKLKRTWKKRYKLKTSRLFSDREKAGRGGRGL